MIEFYTDGSSRKASNTGGFGVAAFRTINNQPILVYAHQEQFTNVTNNQMELKAIIHACEIADKHFPNEEVIIYSDSTYCVNSINEWMSTWVKNKWYNSKKQIVENLDLMKTLYRYFSTDFYHCQVKWLKGHAGNFGNEIVDALATQNKAKFLDTINEHSIKVQNLDF